MLKNGLSCTLLAAIRVIVAKGDVLLTLEPVTSAREASGLVARGDPALTWRTGSPLRGVFISGVASVVRERSETLPEVLFPA